MGNLVTRGFMRSGNTIATSKTTLFSRTLNNIPSKVISRGAHRSTQQSTGSQVGNVAARSREDSVRPDTSDSLGAAVVKETVTKPATRNPLFPFSLLNGIVTLLWTVFVAIIFTWIIRPLALFLYDMLEGGKKRLRTFVDNRNKVLHEEKKVDFMWFLEKSLMIVMDIIVRIIDCIATWITLTILFFFPLLILFLLFLAFYTLERLAVQTVYITAAIVTTGSVLYDNTVVRAGNLFIYAAQVANPHLNMAAYQSYRSMSLFIDFALGREDTPFEEAPVFGPANRRMLMNDIDVKPMLGTLSQALGYFTLINALLFAVQFNIMAIIMFKFFSYLVVYIFPYLGNIINKGFCIMFGFVCALREIFQVTIIAGINFLLTTISFGLIAQNSINIACSSEDGGLLGLPASCQGEFFDINDPGVYYSLSNSAGRRLDELGHEPISLRCIYDENSRYYIETYDDLIIHTDYDELLACPYTRNSLDPVHAAHFMFIHDIKHCFTMCSINTVVEVCHTVTAETTVKNFGKCDQSKPQRYLANTTIPTVRETFTQFSQEHRDLKSTHGKVNKKETIAMLKEKIGGEKFYMLDKFECDLASFEAEDGVWESFYNTLCIAYAAALYIEKNNMHSDTLSSFTHRRHLQGEMEDTLFLGRQLSHSVRLYHALTKSEGNNTDALIKTMDAIGWQFNYNINPMHAYTSSFKTLEKISQKFRDAELTRRRRSLQTASCEIECTENQFCCYNRVQCVTRYEDCEEADNLDIPTTIGLRLAEIQAYFFNFDFVGDIVNARECQELNWKRNPETNPLSPDNLLDDNPDFSKFVYCFPTIPPITGEFEPTDVNIEDILEGWCPGKSNTTGTECECSRYPSHAGFEPQSLTFGIIPAFVSESLTSGLIWTMDFFYVFIPFLYYFFRLFVILIGSFAYTYDYVVELFPYEMDYEETKMCLLYNSSGFIFFLWAILEGYVILMGVSKLIHVEK